MPEARKVEFAARFQPAMLGDVLAIAKAPEGSTEVFKLGIIVGIARGLSFRANPQDPSAPAIALTGVFEGVPSDPARAIIRSTACFLPKSVHELVVASVRGDNGGDAPKMPARGQKVDVAGQEVKVAFEIGAKKSKVAGGAGYEFVTRAIFDPQAVDPLADLKQALLAPPSAQTGADPADGSAEVASEAPKHAGRAHPKK